VAIHALAGISTAGVNLCAGNISLKLAPKGKSTAYLAANSLVSGMAATVAPLIGGVLATKFEGEELSLTLKWISTALQKSWELPTVNLQGLDFIFLISFMLGLHSLHRLTTIREEGEIEEDLFSREFRLEVRKVFKNTSNIAGLRDMFYFPYSYFREVVKKGGRAS